MIVVDTSALLAILLEEAEARSFAALLATSGANMIVSPSYLELNMVLASREAWNPAAVDVELRQLGVEIVPFDLELARVAATAFHRFGRGRHRARLNFGDCFSYALAKQRDAALLFKGDDFVHTDVRPALAT